MSTMLAFWRKLFRTIFDNCLAAFYESRGTIRRKTYLWEKLRFPIKTFGFSAQSSFSFDKNVSAALSKLHLPCVEKKFKEQNLIWTILIFELRWISEQKRIKTMSNKIRQKQKNWNLRVLMYTLRNKMIVSVIEQIFFRFLVKVCCQNFQNCILPDQNKFLRINTSFQRWKLAPMLALWAKQFRTTSAKWSTLF